MFKPKTITYNFGGGEFGYTPNANDCKYAIVLKLNSILQDKITIEQVDQHEESLKIWQIYEKTLMTYLFNFFADTAEIEDKKFANSQKCNL